jgi:hypothetical protein
MEELVLAADDSEGTCSFQFWVDSIESFYCKLDGCGWEGKGGAGKWDRH